MINVGDIVSRNKYNNDMLFKVIKIENNIYYLNGIEIRLCADSELSDLRKEEIQEDDNNDEIENYENMTPENYEEPKIKTKGTFSKELYEKADENENIENGYSGRTEKKKHSKGKRFK